MIHVDNHFGARSIAVNQQEAFKWEKTRVKGETAYVIGRVLVWWLASVPLIIMFLWDSSGRAPWYVFPAVIFSVFSGIGYLVGSCGWRKIEREYAEYLADNGNGKTETR